MKMMQLDNYESLDLFADLMEPVTEILSDPEIKKAYSQDGAKLVNVVSLAIKRHKQAIIQILAYIDGEDVETYKINVFTLPMKVLQFLNDKEVRAAIPFLLQKKETESSGDITENTQA